MDYARHSFSVQAVHAATGELRVFRLGGITGLLADMQVLTYAVVEPLSYSEDLVQLHHPAVTAVPFRRELIPYYNFRYREWAERRTREPDWVVKVRIPLTETKASSVYLETALVIFKWELYYFSDVHTLAITSPR